MKKIIYISVLGLLLFSVPTHAQDLLTKEKAVEIALENNYDIQVRKNNIETAKNNKSVYNSGYLPTVTANAGANYANSNTEIEFEDGTINSVTGAESDSYNASIGLNYTLFDGFNRKNTFKKLKESYNLTELQARQIIENTLITVYFAYYEVARLTENVTTQSEMLAISKQRLERANYSFEYGQSTKLEVLNAEVDVNNDSITILDVKRQLANAKRDLNVVLGRAVHTSVNVETGITYAIDLNLADLLEKAESNNANLLQTKKSMELGKLDIKINKSGWRPNVVLTSSYAWNKINSDATNRFSPLSNLQTGFNAGVNLSWNIFDGGRTKTKVANAKIALATQEIQKVQQEEQLKRDVYNAWETYQNALFTLQVQESNVNTNKRNFERTNEQYKLGQITSLDFRQAQVNLLNAKLNASQAKYEAKNAEFQLLQLAGAILE